MKRAWYVIFCSLIIGIFLFLQGCGDTNLFEGMADDSSEAARLEQVKQDLNAGNFDNVIAYLETKLLTDLTEQETRYLASAYVGKAGFDALTLIEKITEEDDTGGDTEIFSFIADIFDEDADGEILRSEVVNEGDPNNPLGKLDYIDSAIEVLDPDINSQSEDSLQRGVYAAVHAVLTISLAVSDQYDGYSDPDDPILLTDEDLQEVCGDSVDLDDDVILQDRLDDLNRDLAIVQSTVNDLETGDDEEDNDVGLELDEFLTNIGYSEADPVTGDKLENYLEVHIL